MEKRIAKRMCKVHNLKVAQYLQNDSYPNFLYCTDIGGFFCVCVLFCYYKQNNIKTIFRANIVSDITSNIIINNVDS